MLYNLLILWMILLIIFFRGLLKQNTLTKLLYLFLSGLSLVLLSSFRFETGGDFYNNYVGFLRASSMTFKEIFFNYDEYGHMYLRKLISLFTDNPQWYFAVSATFIIVSFFIFIYRYSPNIYFSVLLFVTIGGYFVSHNITRQFIAISICLYAIPSLISRKSIKYFLTILLAMTFHTSAFVMSPLYFLANIRITKKVILLYMISFVVIVLTFDIVFPFIHQFVYSDSYHEGNYGTTGANLLNIVLPSILFLLLIYFMRIMKEKEQQLESRNQVIFYRMLFHMGILSFLFNIIGTIHMLILYRLSFYFSVSYLIIIPLLICSIEKKSRPLFYLFFLVIAIGFFSISNYLGRLIPTPYTPFWWY